MHLRTTSFVSQRVAIKMNSLFTPSNPLRKQAYSNILNILQSKTENFQIKNSDIFFIFLLKT